MSDLELHGDASFGAVQHVDLRHGGGGDVVGHWVGEAEVLAVLAHLHQSTQKGNTGRGEQVRGLRGKHSGFRGAQKLGRVSQKSSGDERAAPHSRNFNC